MTHVIAGVLLAATVLIAPGLLLARLGGVRGWGAVSAALPLSCAVIGISEVVAAAGGWAWVPWGWAAIAGTTAVAAGVLAIVRRIRLGSWWVRPADRPRGPRARRDDILVLCAVVVACLVLAVGTLIGMGSVSTPGQSFDIVFHLNAVQAIREIGNASSFGSMAALYQGTPTYYPTVWHGVVALLPASVTVASNAMVLVVGSLAWPLAVAGLLVEALDDDDAHPQSRTAVALAVVLSAATVGAPTMLLGTLSVWAYSVSVVCLPGVLVLGLRLASVLSLRAGFPQDTWMRPAPLSGLLTGSLLFAGAGIGVILAHGAGTFNTMVLLGPLVVVFVIRLVRAGGRCRTVTLSVLGVLAVCALVGGLVMHEALAWVWGYPRSGGNFFGTLAGVLLDVPQYGPLVFNALPLGIGLPLGVVTCGLAVLAAMRVPRARPWLVVAVLALCLVTLVGGPQWWGRRIGALWYLQKSRVQPLLVIPGLVLAAMGLRYLLERCPGRRALTVLVAVVCVTALGRMPLQADLARSIYAADRIPYGTMVTPEDVEFMRTLQDKLPDDALVLGAPARGETYLWSLGGVNVVYRLRSKPTLESAEELLARQAPDLRPGSYTCELLHKLGAEYYLKVDRSGTEWEGRQAPLRWDTALATWPTDDMELVASTSTVSLWRITACG